MGTKLDEDQTPTGVLAKIRANPTGRLVLRIGVGTLGTLVVALGIVLIPFPGPGWAVVILGLAIWSLEFTWAKRLLEYTKRRVRGWTKWVTTRPWPLRAVIGVAGLLFVGAVVWASVRLSFHVDLVQEGLQWWARR